MLPNFHHIHKSQLYSPLPQSKDPTSGFVNYVDRDTANQNGYIDTVDNQVYLGVDYTNNVNGNGRDSVRICSNAVYNYGLVVLDVSHMPGGICGTWQVLPRPIALIETRPSTDIRPTLGQHSGCLEPDPNGLKVAKLTLLKASMTIRTML